MTHQPPPLFAQPPEPPAAKPAERPEQAARPTTYTDPETGGERQLDALERLHGFPAYREGARPWIDKPKT